MGAQFLARLCTQISRCNVQHGLTAGLTFLVHPISGTRTGNQYRAGELRIGVQLQAVLNDVIARAVAGLARTDNETTVRQYRLMR